MKTKLNVYCGDFNGFSVIVNPATIKYHGSVEGYGHSHEKNFCGISFEPLDQENIDKLVEEIESKFNLNKDYCKVENYLKVIKSEDKPTRVYIRFTNGSQGFKDSPSFGTQLVEEKVIVQDTLAGAMERSKDYQLWSLIGQFSRFRGDVTTNTADEVLRLAIFQAKAECDKRGIGYEYPKQEA